MSKVALLSRVAEHKQIYFRAGSARYNLAKKGTLKLTPQPHVEKKMRQDYQAMQEMFFPTTTPPTWNEIMIAIKEFEHAFNTSLEYC